ncbi:MAG: hypothetical protein JRE40_07690 [Deltaproteobacteria bacterium]|nr:hypothetical protein [Deltaproteobacteria bacterium]MBW2674014.1 hypothetical protein [Deltaproteobacteria bacterium]
MAKPKSRKHELRVWLDEHEVQQLDAMIRQKKFSSYSDAVRHLVRVALRGESA